MNEEVIIKEDEQIVQTRPIVPFDKKIRYFISLEVIRANGKDFIMLPTDKFRLMETYGSRDFGPNGDTIMLINVLEEKHEESK